TRNGLGIWKVPVQGGEALPVVRNAGWGPVESPDGRFLYYVKTQPGTDRISLWKVPVEGGEESQVLESLSGELNYVIVDEGIYFNPRTDPGRDSFIQFLNFATGSGKQIAAVKKPVAAG